MDFAVPSGHRVKIKENEKINKSLNFARQLKKQGKTMVTTIAIVVGALRIVTKVQMKKIGKLEIRGRNKCAQILTVLKLAKILLLTFIGTYPKKNRLATFSNRLRYMNVAILADQQRLTYNVDTGCSSEDFPGVVNDGDGWLKRVRKLCAISTT